MIYNKPNETFEYEGKKYKIGDKVVVTPADKEYEGLIGIITEICDGEDKETDNETPDIYCNFFKPIIPYDIEQLEKRFSIIFQETKKLDDINLDQVIMSPEMIEVITNFEKKGNDASNVYIVVEDLADNCECESTEAVFTDLALAKAYMRDTVRQAADYGGVFDRRGDKDCVEESSDLFYEIYIEGWYCTCHYNIRIEEKTLHKTQS